METADTKKFKQYLAEFENTVIIPGLRKKVFGKELVITTRQGRLHKTPFGQMIGLEFEYEEIAAIDYYGLLKKSSGFYRHASETSQKAIRAHVIHFPSIKIEHISDLHEKLVAGFPTFKKHLISLRGFV
ncbi:MAG: hypothetical protein DRJ03_00925 [Chloroflexi bacterium]|nr:MAG: hypothetical protein DRJ03_00925 [Chloroflexota bacterium]